MAIDFTIYKDIKYHGDSLRIQYGPGWRFDANLHESNWGDTISSIRVDSGYLVVFQDINFNGSWQQIGPGERLPDLESWSDQISSYISCDKNFDIAAGIEHCRGH